MKLFKKEKVGSRRILTICGMKFEYNTAKKYNFSEITESGVNKIYHGFIPVKSDYEAG